MLSKKQILADPIKALEQISLPLSDEQQLSLDTDYGKRNELVAKKTQLQQEKGKNSRLIGEKKKVGESADELIAMMKGISQEIGAIDTQLKEIETSILHVFASQPQSSKQQDTKESEQNEWKPITRYAWDVAINAENLSIIAFDHEHAKAWDNYVNAHPAASNYHLLRWKSVVEKSFGHRCHYLIAYERDQVVGVLPLVQLQSKLFGNFMVSQAFFNYGGALGDSVEVEKKLMESGAELARTLGCSHVEYRDDFAREGLPARTDKVAMMLALPTEADHLWDSIGSKLRAQVRRPQKEQCETKIGGIELLDDYYHVFSINMRDLGTPVYSKQFFSNILELFPKQSRLVVVYHQGQAVGTAFLLGYRDTLEIPWASTLRKVNHLSVNMLLYWRVLEFAISKGYRWFDFGRSTADAGTYRFKQQWGAKPRQLYWHYWLADGGELPQINPNNPKYKLLIAVWQRLPVWFTKIIGPFVVRNLP